jgi:hypothetical protein
MERWRAGGWEIGLTFIVCGIWREAYVHRPLNRTIEAVCV